jgi:broad specificity phosphatase PhoE
MQQAPAGGESAAAFVQRVEQAFADLLQRRAALQGDLLVVTHGLLIRTMLAGPLRQDAGSVAALHLGNTSLTIFDAAPPHVLQLLNCARHLDDADRDQAHSLSGG